MASRVVFRCMSVHCERARLSDTNDYSSKKRLNTIIRGEGYKLEGDQVVPASIGGENWITKTTEITITEIDREDAPEAEPATPEAETTSSKPNKVTKDTATKVTKKRKTFDRSAPKEVLKKKQKKVVEQTMREGSAEE